MTIGVIGLGDMGLAMANNLIQDGFTVKGFDLNDKRRAMLAEKGGIACESAQELADAEAVFVMVLNGNQAIAVANTLKDILKPGSTVVLTATIKREEAIEVGSILADKGIDIIDSPVSGGRAGAEAGTLTLMLAASDDVLSRNRKALEAVSGTIHHVGQSAGDGQTVKSALQAIFGCTFAGIYEAVVLGSKAGLSGQVMADVFSTAGCASPALKNSIQAIVDRQFEGTGSGIRTMHKDLSVTMDMSRSVGAALPTTSAAYELFQAGMCRYPDGDNQTIVRLLEEIAGTKVER